MPSSRTSSTVPRTQPATAYLSSAAEASLKSVQLTAKEYDEMRAARQEVKNARKLVEQAKDTERELAAFYALGKQLINARQNKRVIAPLFEELERLVNAYKF